MDGDLFIEWVKELDRKFAAQDRKIFWIADNCPIHPKVDGLKAVELKYSIQSIGLKPIELKYSMQTITRTEHVHLLSFEVTAIEFYQNNQKWFLLGLYKPPNQKMSEFIQNLSLKLDLFNVTLIGSFNLSSNDVPLECFLQAYNLTSLIKEATCFQSSNPSCIDLVLGNQKYMYKLSQTFETGISDHHNLISTVAKSGSFKRRPQEKSCRSYRSFNNEIF